MTTTPDPRPENFAEAYKTMAIKTGYRPAAPSDGSGNITVPLAELNLDEEAAIYADRWIGEEETDEFFIGCTHFPYARATAYTIEAARNLCAGVFGLRNARRLLKLALQELDTVAPER